MKCIREFGKEDRGQVLVEYVLLIWFIMMATVAVAVGYNHSIAGINAATDSNLASANTLVSK